MIGWLLDTNVLAELSSRRAEPRVVAWAAAQPEETLFISVLTLAEYDKGIAALPEEDPARAPFAAALSALEVRFSDRILSAGDGVVRRWGVISGNLKRRIGHPPPVIDTLLAASAIEYRLYLVTRNVRDVENSGAVIFNPWTDDPEEFWLE
jgi:toxin FitB